MPERNRSKHNSSQTGDAGHSGLELSLEPHPDSTPARCCLDSSLVTR